MIKMNEYFVNILYEICLDEKQLKWKDASIFILVKKIVV
jgi:hypothetical protein